MSRIWDQSDRPLNDREARHQAILSGMKTVLRQRIRRRRAVRNGATGVAAAALVVGASLMFRSAAVSPRTESRGTSAPSSPVPTATSGFVLQHASFQFVETRSVSALTGVSITVLDDDQLLAELRGMGRSAGLIRTRDAVVVTGDVTIKAGGSGAPPGQS